MEKKKRIRFIVDPAIARQRILSILEEFKLTDTDFCMSVKISNETLRRIKQGGAGLTEQTATRIMEGIKELNKDFLLYGNLPIRNLKTTPICEFCLEKDKLIEQYKNLIDKVTEEYKTQLNEQRKTIEHLTNFITRK